MSDLNPELLDAFNRAKNWIRPKDPIILDLNNNGLETVGLAANIYFDHDGDGVLTKTGWVGKDDGLLVWDRNANGRIDTGAELFGDFTPLPDGKLAPNGFAALAALDSNRDGILDASDPAFAELKLWRDVSQDGVSQGGEFITLTEAGIVSLKLSATLNNQTLANGNILSREGTFTRADGASGSMGEFKLAIDTFDTQFAEQIEVPEALKTLPNMGGSGNVRELQQAAAQSDTLAGLLAQFQTAGTRSEQRGILGQLISAWADTAGMLKTLEERVDKDKYLVAYNLSGIPRPSGSTGNPNYYNELLAEWKYKLHVLEAFNGQYFFNVPGEHSQTASANSGLSISGGGGSGGGGGFGGKIMLTLTASLSQPQLDLLRQAYASLEDSIYASLAMQTRLKPYLDQIGLVIDDAGIRLDATQINQMLADKLALDPENGLADLMDIDRYADSVLSGSNWRGMADFDTLLASLPQTPGITALLADFKVRQLTYGADEQRLSSSADIVLAGDGKDTLYGYSGNDRLFGQGGDDSLYGGEGDDLISGGAGNDRLYGDNGADTYVFARGYGHDTISGHAENDEQRDIVRFLGLTPADIEVSADYLDNLRFTIRDTGETLAIKNGIANNGNASAASASRLFHY